jgi:hypothetical protein
MTIKFAVMAVTSYKELLNIHREDKKQINTVWLFSHGLSAASERKCGRLVRAVYRNLSYVCQKVALKRNNEVMKLLSSC